MSSRTWPSYEGSVAGFALWFLELLDLAGQVRGHLLLEDLYVTPALRGTRAGPGAAE